MSLFSRKSSHSDFWEWFTSHSEEYLQLEAEQGRLLNQLAKQLGKTEPLLSFMIGPETNGRRELFISCDGVRTEIPNVRALVAAAPVIPSWKITAFKPAIAIESAEYEGLRMDISDILFDASPNENGLLDIVIFIPGYKSEAQDKNMGLAFTILDGLLGEEGVMTRLGVIEFGDLENIDRSKLQPIRNLVQIIKNMA